MLKRSSTDKLTALLALPATGQEQDWEIELSNENRINEFLEAYEDPSLSHDDKFALMALILASVDRYLQSKSRAPEAWQSIAAILINEGGLHQETVRYWRCDGEAEPQAWFFLTPHLRALVASGPGTII